MHTLYIGAAALAVCLASCQAEPPPPIQLAIGPSDSDRRSFVPQKAFAEFLQMPGGQSELRITLAEYEASCDRFVSPGEGQASVTVAVVTPGAAPPKTGTYAWAPAAAPKPDGPAHPYARPSARMGKVSYQFQPGGSIRLTEVDLESGTVGGVLAFEFPGNSEHPASSIRGRFHAQMCPGEHAAAP